MELSKHLLGGGLSLDSRGFKQLLDSQSLVDCTLACDGGKISAHKVVLSACSSYLAKVLIEHPVEHPIIVLPELNIEDVKTLIHYMYTGELLNTYHSTSLLKTAAILSVNSLNDFLNGTLNNNNNVNSSSISNSNDHNHHHQINTTYTNMVNISSYLSNGNSNNNNNNDNNTNSSSNINDQIQPSKNEAANFLSGGTSITATNIHANNYLSPTYNSSSKSDFQFKCPVCQNDFQTICSFEYHMQRVHNVTSFGCEICHKPFASLRYVLTDHMRRCHGWKAEQKLGQY